MGEWRTVGRSHLAVNQAFHIGGSIPSSLTISKLGTNRAMVPYPGVLPRR